MTHRELWIDQPLREQPQNTRTLRMIANVPPGVLRLITEGSVQKVVPA
jgi:hypothetical protein